MPTPAGHPLLVTTSADEAREESAAGRDVVLILPPGSTRAGVGGPGRVHLFVGDPSDPATHRAAAEMAAELGAVGRRA
jgi:hypothetical protein